MGCPGEIRYVRSADGLDVAFTVFGEGDLDIVAIPGFVTHLDAQWDFPWMDYMGRLSRFSRFITFDKRGTGLSDRSLGFGSLEERSDDILAVMDAAGSERAVIYGVSEGGPMAILFAARYPERVHALVLYGTAARFVVDDDYPDALTDADLSTLLGLIDGLWGQGACYGFFVQNPPDRELAQRALAPFERAACTPRMAREIMERNAEIDVRPLLGTVSVPTLVLHCAGDPVVPVALGRYLGENIPGARYVELPGNFHGSWRAEDLGQMVGSVAEFLSELGAAEPPEPPSDRVLATVMFTDIVGSTERVSDAGDRTWRDVLDRHDRVAAERVARHGGRLVKSTGDGALATFGGPSAALDAARAIRDSVAGMGIEIRAGVHTGEVELRGDDVAGIAVHIAARIADLAHPGRIWVSRTVKDLVTGSGATFDDRDEHELKGVADRWRLYELCG